MAALIALFTFLYPLFYLSITPDSYEFNKLILLAGTILVLLFLYSLRIAHEKRLEVIRGSFGTPLFLLTAVMVASTVFQSPNVIVALITPLSTSTVIAGWLLYFFLIQIIGPTEKKLLVLMSIFSSVLIALYTILLYLEFLPKNLFTPAGNLLSTCIFLGIISIYVLNQLLSLLGKLIATRGGQTTSEEHEETKSFFILYGVAFLIMIIAVIILAYHLVVDQQPIILPFRYGWLVFLEQLKNIKTILLGVGPTNFMAAFSLAKPPAFNTTQYWNIIFTTSSSHLLTLISEIGIFPVIVFLIIFIRSAGLLIRAFTNLQKNTFEIFSVIALLVALILQFILPSSMTVFITTIILLALVSESKPGKSLDLHRLGKFIYLLPIFITFIIAILGYFTGRAYLAEMSFKQALDSMLNNQAAQAYDKIKKAIELDPYVDRYHLAYSQTSLSIATTLLAKKDLNADDKQNLPRLLQQSINEGKAAVILYRTNTVNWDSLGRMYATIMPIVNESSKWAIQSFQQRILLDPANPSGYISLGGVFFSMKQYTDAEKEFRTALRLKPDVINAHYNLGLTLKEQKKYDEAYKELTITRGFLESNSPDAKRVDADLTEVSKYLSGQTASGSSEMKTKK